MWGKTASVTRVHRPKGIACVDSVTGVTPSCLSVEPFSSLKWYHKEPLQKFSHSLLTGSGVPRFLSVSITRSKSEIRLMVCHPKLGILMQKMLKLNPVSWVKAKCWWRGSLVWVTGRDPGTLHTKIYTVHGCKWCSSLQFFDPPPNFRLISHALSTQTQGWSLESRSWTLRAVRFCAHRPVRGSGSNGGSSMHLEVEWFSKGKSAGNWKPGSLPSKHISSLVLPCTNSGVTGLLPWLAYTVIPLHYSLWAYDQCCNQWILGLPANPPKPTQPSKNWMNGNLQKTPTLEAKTMVSCRCSLKPIYWNPSCITFRRSRHSQPAGVPASGPPPFAACCAHAPASCASKGQRSAGGKWGAAVGWTSISGRPLAPWTIKVGCLVGWWVDG